ncbi:MAG: hypothetical protein PHF29_07550 [Candidatus Riflebacteria bacterium]|nr:hypothetical protein [Candidatus Riflebacteria bacterium]
MHLGHALKINDVHVGKIAEMVADFSGIVIDRLFLKQVARKIALQMDKYAISKPDEYISMLKQGENFTFVMEDLIAALTVSESYFFRNPAQFEYLYYEYFPWFFNEPAKNGIPLRVWSAGCSRGEEPYSVAVLLANYKNKYPWAEYIIKAGDINSLNLEAARKGIYSVRSVRDKFSGFEKILPEKFGVFNEFGNFVIDKKFAEQVIFDKLNLNQGNELKKLNWSDIIMCRNVLIYFKDELKARLLEAFFECLNPGGLLLLGETECLPSDNSKFEVINYKNTYVFKKNK